MCAIISGMSSTRRWPSIQPNTIIRSSKSRRKSRARPPPPLELDIDNPAFFAGLERLRKIAEAGAATQAKGGIAAKLGKARTAAAAGLAFVRLLMLPAKSNALPQNIRMAPSW
jgi:hypothetical protein